jgi:hypothetical protein
MSARIPPPLTWHICYNIVDSLGPIVYVCILSHYRGHWLLNDALNSAICMNIKFKEKLILKLLTTQWKNMEMLFMSYFVWPPM